MSSDEIRDSAIAVGLRDRQMSGWCDSGTRELVGGVVIEPGMQVVDIGCGDGGYITFCARMGADVTFVDLNGDKVAALTQKLEQENNGGTVRGLVSDCNPIPIPDGHADIVMSTEVLEHVRDPEQFIREIVRVGGDNATYVLTVPDARGENLIRDIAHPAYFSEPNHIQTFTAEDFEKLVTDAGLEVVRQEFIAGFWAIFYLLKWATSLPGESLIENVHPQTTLWTQTWEEVLNHPAGNKIRAALNNALPRCQMIVARRRSANVG